MSATTINKIFLAAIACATALQVTIDTIEDGLASESQYQQLADLKNDEAMAQFIQRLVASSGHRITSMSELSGLAPWYSGTRAVQSLAALQDDLAKKWWVVHEDDQAEYEKVAAKRDDDAMSQFIQRLVASKGYNITSLSELSGLAPWYSGTRADQNISALQDELARSWWVIPKPAFEEQEGTSPFESKPREQASVDATVPRQEALIATEHLVSAEKQSLDFHDKFETKAHARVYDFLVKPADNLFSSFPRQEAAEAQFDVKSATVKPAASHASRAQEPNVPQAQFATNRKLVEDAATHAHLLRERPMAQAIFVSSPLKAPAEHDTLSLKSLSAPVQHSGNDSRRNDDLVENMDLFSGHVQEHQETHAGIDPTGLLVGHDANFSRKVEQREANSQHLNTTIVEQKEYDPNVMSDFQTTLVEQVDFHPQATSEFNNTFVEQVKVDPKAKSAFTSSPEKQVQAHLQAKSEFNTTLIEQAPLDPQTKFGFDASFAEQAKTDPKPKSDFDTHSEQVDVDPMAMSELNTSAEQLESDPQTKAEFNTTVVEQGETDPQAKPKFNTKLVEQVEMDQQAKPEFSATLMKQVVAGPKTKPESNISLVDQRAGRMSTMEVRFSPTGKSKPSDKKRAKASTGKKAQDVSHGTKRKPGGAKTHPEEHNVRLTIAAKPAKRKGTATFEHKVVTSATAADKNAAKEQRRGHGGEHHHMKAKAYAGQRERRVTR